MLKAENNLLTIGFNLTHSNMNNLIHNKNNLNNSFNQLISSNNLNRSSSIESDDFKHENDYLELSFDDIIDDSNMTDNELDNPDYSFEKIKSNFNSSEKIKSNMCNKSKPIPITTYCNQNYFSNNFPLKNSVWSIYQNYYEYRKRYRKFIVC